MDLLMAACANIFSCIQFDKEIAERIKKKLLDTKKYSHFYRENLI